MMKIKDFKQSRKFQHFIAGVIWGIVFILIGIVNNKIYYGEKAGGFFIFLMVIWIAFGIAIVIDLVRSERK